MGVAPGERPVAPAGRERLVTPVFGLITLSTFAYFLAVGALLPVLPRYVRGPLGGGDVAVGVAIGSFSLAAIAVRPLIGRMADRQGRRMLIIGGASLVAASTAAYLAADTLWLLILLRVANGVGEAMFYVGVASSINDIAPDDRRGEALSLFSLALYAGLAVGPLVGEIVLAGRHYSVVWTMAAATSAAAAAVGLWLPETRPHIDSHEIEHPLLHPAALLPGVVLAANVWGMAAFNSFVTLFALQLGLAGGRFVFLTYSITILLVRSIGARIPDAVGPVRTVSASLVLSAAALLWLATVRGPATLYVASGAFGAGQSLAFPALMTLAVRGAPDRQRGAVVGSFTAFFDLAYALGPISLGAVAAFAGYRGVFVGGAVVAMAGLAVLLAGRRRLS